MTYETRFLAALGVTIVSETAVLLALVRWLYRLTGADLPTRYCLGAGILASVATLPYLWFILPALIWAYLPRTILGEVGIVLIESIIYVLILRLPMGRALVASVIANTVSFTLGLIALPW